VPFSAIAPMIVVSCAIGALRDPEKRHVRHLLMPSSASSGYVFKRSAFRSRPSRSRSVLGNRAEDSFRLSMIGAGGDMRVFWSNGLVGSITTLALVLLFWPLVGGAFERMRSAFAGKTA